MQTRQHKHQPVRGHPLSSGQPIAAGGGGLAVGAAGSFILAGGLVVAVIGVIAVGFVAYTAYENFLHEDPPEEACI